MAQHLYAGNGRDHQIKQDNIKLIGLGQFQAFLAVNFDSHIVARPRQGPDVEFANKVLILDDQNFTLGGLRRCVFWIHWYHFSASWAAGVVGTKSQSAKFQIPNYTKIPIIKLNSNPQSLINDTECLND